MMKKGELGGVVIVTIEELRLKIAELKTFHKQMSDRVSMDTIKRVIAYYESMLNRKLLDAEHAEN